MDRRPADNSSRAGTHESKVDHSNKNIVHGLMTESCTHVSCCYTVFGPNSQFYKENTNMTQICNVFCKFTTKRRRIRDEWRYQNGWIFGKVPNGLWPPPHFWKNTLQYFCMLEKPCLKVQNLQHKFGLKMTPHPPPLEFFWKSSVLVASPVPNCR